MSLIEINKDPTPSQLRWFGLSLAGSLGVVGGLVYWRADALLVAGVLWSIGFLAGGVYYLLPPIRRTMFVGWMYAVYPIGWVVSHVVLAVTFYLVIAPMGLVMRCCGRNPMKRRFDSATDSYWQPHTPAKDNSDYFRQF